jgi:hypothetical protein
MSPLRPPGPYPAGLNFIVKIGLFPKPAWFWEKLKPLSLFQNQAGFGTGLGRKLLISEHFPKPG